MKLGDLGRSLGQIITAIGTKAVEDVAKNLSLQLAAELGSMDIRRRKVAGDRLKRQLASKDFALPTQTVKRLDGLVTHAIIEGRPEIILGPLDQTATELGWTQLQRVGFLTKVMPDAPISVKGVTVEGLSIGTPPKDEPK